MNCLYKLDHVYAFNGNIAVIECNCNHVEIIYPNDDGHFVTAANEFTSDKMKIYNNNEVDTWKAEERYLVSYNTLKKCQNSFSVDLIRDILSGKYGFMCQYDRNRMQIRCGL